MFKRTFFVMLTVGLLFFMGECLFAQEVFAAEVTLMWDANSPEEGVTEYRVYYGTSSNGYAFIYPPANEKLSDTQCTIHIEDPEIDRTYYFAVKAFDDTGNSSDYSNEASTIIPAGLSIPMQDPLTYINAIYNAGIPDLTITSLSAPSALIPGQTITLSCTTKNLGPEAAADSSSGFYLSSNATLDSSDIALATAPVPPLAVGASFTVSVSVDVPSVLTGNTYYLYYLIAKADAGGAVAEKTETNNTRYITVRISRPDLYIYALTAPLTAQSGQTITIQDTTKNQGMSGAVASTTKFYLSKNSTLDGSETPLGSRPVPPFPKGAGSGPVPTEVTIPIGLTSGTYYIIAKADADGAVTESLETNNTKYRTIKIMP